MAFQIPFPLPLPFPSAMKMRCYRLFAAAAFLIAAAVAPPPPSFQACFPSPNASYVPGSISNDDANGLQVALNIEYFEAEFFLYSALGHGLDYVAPGLAGGYAANPYGAQVAYVDDSTRDLIAEFGYQEVGHIRAIKETLGSSAFSRPFLNLSRGVWNEFMSQAMGMRLEPPFDPYADTVNFLLAAYIIPYIGLTGYVGGSRTLETPTAKRLVAGLLGVESGQDAVIRDRLSQRASRQVVPYSFTVADATEMISTYRSNLDRSLGVNDEGIRVPTCLGAERRTTQNTLGGDVYSVSYARTPAQVLAIVYGTGDASCPGSFLPHGGRGNIAESLANEGGTVCNPNA